MRLANFNDLFYATRQTKQIGAARPSERLTLLKYMQNLLRDCEKEDRRLPILRKGVNCDK